MAKVASRNESECHKQMANVVNAGSRLLGRRWQFTSRASETIKNETDGSHGSHAVKMVL